MSDFNSDMLKGEVSEPTGYTPIPAGRYQAVIAVAEIVDPVLMGWEPSEDATPAQREDFFMPYPRLRWQIEALENGDPSDYAGRMTDQRLSFKMGVNPKTGRSFAESRADLLRLANGLKASDEVTGLSLIDVSLTGLNREESVAAATAGMQKYVGLRGVVRVGNSKNKKTGEQQDAVHKIVLPK